MRLAPHHFANIQASIREAARVLRPGGRYLVVDTISPEEDELDRQLNEIELMRDPSHVRNYRESEWLQMLTSANLTVAESQGGRCGVLEFEDWTRRQNVAPERKEALRQRFANASPALNHLLEFTAADGIFRFTLPQVTILAHEPR